MKSVNTRPILRNSHKVPFPQSMLSYYFLDSPNPNHELVSVFLSRAWECTSATAGLNHSPQVIQALPSVCQLPHDPHWKTVISSPPLPKINSLPKSWPPSAFISASSPTTSCRPPWYRTPQVFPERMCLFLPASLS